jgi:hypothetical protein
MPALGHRLKGYVMAAKAKSSEAQLPSCPYCSSQIMPGKLKKHLQKVHRVKEFITIHQCAEKHRINERKVLELAQKFGCAVNAASDHIPIDIANKINGVFGFRSQTGIRKPKGALTKVEPRFVEGGLPSLGKRR